MFLTLFDFFKVFAVMIWMLSDLFDRSRKPWSHFCWGLDLTPWEYLSKRLCSTNGGTTNPPNETCRAGLYLQEWSALNRRQLHAGMTKSHCVFCSCNLVVFTSQLWLIGDTAVESEVYESQGLVGQIVLRQGEFCEVKCLVQGRCFASGYTRAKNWEECG